MILGIVRYHLNFDEAMRSISDWNVHGLNSMIMGTNQFSLIYKKHMVYIIISFLENNLEL